MTGPLEQRHVEVNKAGPIYRWEIEQCQGVTKQRKLYKISGVGLDVEFGVHDNSIGNVQRGLYERVLYRVKDGTPALPPSPTAEAYTEELSLYRRLLVEATPVSRPLTRDQVVGAYEGRKRTLYQNAAESLRTKPLNVSDSFVSTFVKCEKLRLWRKQNPVPRVIQPRSPRYNLEVARYLKRLEKVLLSGVADVWGGKTVLKGMNPVQVAEAIREMWDEFTDPVAIPIDATRFDQHVSTEALEWEHSVYLAMFPKYCRPKLKRLLDMQLENHGYARTAEGVIKYTVAGRRMSGDINTGLGNCLLMTAVMFALRQATGLHFRLANNGDDCVIVCERGDLGSIQKALPTHGLKFGFVLEIEPPVDVFEEISFCQTQPVFDGSAYIMVRDPRVAIDKDLVTVIDLEHGGAKWCKAVGDCGLAIAGGVPMQQHMYRMLQRVGKPGKVGNDPFMDGGFAMMSRGMDRTFSEPPPECRLSYWRAFGMLPDAQTAFEEYWDQEVLVLSAGERSSPLSSYQNLL